MGKVKLIATRISEHNSIVEALGEAKNFVRTPREVSKNEETLKNGDQITIKEPDFLRKGEVVYTVRLDVQK